MKLSFVFLLSSSFVLLLSLLARGSRGIIIPVRFRPCTKHLGFDLPQMFYPNEWVYYYDMYYWYDEDAAARGRVAAMFCLSAGCINCVSTNNLISDYITGCMGYATGEEPVNQTLDSILSRTMYTYGPYYSSSRAILHINRTDAHVVQPPWAAYNSPFHGIDAASITLVNGTLSFTVVIASVPNTTTTLTLAAEGQPLEHELTVVFGGTTPKASPYWTYIDENYNEWYMIRYATISVPWTVLASSDASVGALMLITQDSTYTYFRLTLTASSTNDLYDSVPMIHLLPIVVKMPRVATATLTFSTEYPLDNNTSGFWVTFATGITRQDATNKTASVEFWTTVPLPYYLNTSMITAISPAGTAVSVQLLSGTTCTADPCVQQWAFSFDNVCTLHVVMAVSFGIACTPPESCDIGGQTTSTTVTLDFAGGKECDPVIVIPTATIALELHKETVDTPAVTTITNGDQAVIKIIGTSIGANLTNVRVDSIVYWSNAGGVAGPQMTLMADGVCSSSKCTENSITAQSVGADTAEISFVANCGVGSLVLFEQGIDSTVAWTFQVGVIFTYEGQQKRSYLTVSTATEPNTNGVEVYSFTVDARTDAPDGSSPLGTRPVALALAVAVAFIAKMYI